jgi:hypothetical protein
MKASGFIILITIVLLLFAAGCSGSVHESSPKLLLTNSDTGQIIWSTNVISGDEFVLEYTHSVHKTPVKDYYTVTDDGQMILVKSAFSTFGAGMPYESEYEFSVEDGFFVINSIDRTVDSFLMRIVPLADHRLVMGNQTIYLNDLVPTGTLILVSIK